MNTEEKAALDVLAAIAPFLPARVGPLVPVVVKLMEAALAGDEDPKTYLQGVINTFLADLQAQARAKFG